MSDSVRPHRRQPARLCHPWDSPGKNTGVGCHFLLQCMKVKGESEVAQSCPTLSDHMDCSLPGSSAHGIFQARVLEWGAISFSALLLIDYNNNYCLISGRSDSKESAYKEGDPDSIPGLGRSPGELNGNLLQYSCLENTTDKGGWWATTHAVPKSRTQLST